MKILAGQIVGPRQIEMVEVPVPEVGEGQILVRVEAGAVCGSDLPFFLHEMDHPALAGHTLPLPPFYSLHELVGHVEVSRCSRFREGDRVLALPYVQQGLAECFLSDPDVTVPIPAGPADLLVLSQPLGTIVHACLKLPNILGWTAVVLGQGPIGQLFTALLRQMGVARLIAIDLLPERLEVSRQMGATHTLCGPEEEVHDAVMELTSGKGSDLVVEAVGYAETVNEAARMIRRNGTLLQFGVPHLMVYPFAVREFFRNEGRLINSVGPDVQHDFPIAVDLIASGTIDVSPIVTHHFPLAQAQEAFSMFADRREGVIKAILTGPS